MAPTADVPPVALALSRPRRWPGPRQQWMLTKTQHVWPSPRPPLPQRTPRGKECGLHALTHKRFHRQHADPHARRLRFWHASSAPPCQGAWRAPEGHWRGCSSRHSAGCCCQFGYQPGAVLPTGLARLPAARRAARSSRHSPRCCFQFGYLLLASLSAVASAVAPMEASVVVSDARRDGRNERRTQQTTDVASLSAVVSAVASVVVSVVVSDARHDERNE